MKKLLLIWPLLLALVAIVHADGVVGPGGLGGGVSGPVGPTPTPSSALISFTEDTTSLLRNPNVGLQSNQSTETETNNAGLNPNALPISISNWRCNWSSIEATQGVRDFSCFTDALVRIRADLQTANIRMYETDPGSDIFAPGWTRTGTNLSGWTASHDDSGGSGSWPFWDDADNRTAYAATVQAMATAVAGYPAVEKGIVDQSVWGAYNEVNYSGTHYVSGVTGIAPTPVGGVGNKLPTPAPTPLANLISIQPTAFPNVVNVGFPDDVNSTNNSVAYGMGLRGDGWGYRNVVGSPTSDLGSVTSNVQMGTLYSRSFASDYSSAVATPVTTPAHPNLWQTKPVGLETWSTWNSWHSSSWPFQSSFDWAVDNHASWINNKGQFNPHASWATPLQSFVRSIGYRYFLSDVSHAGSVDVSAGSQSFSIETNWINRGNAPSYDQFKILFKLVGKSDGYVYKFKTTDTVNFLPNVATEKISSVTIPDYLPAQTYDVFVAVGDDWPELRLAVTANPANRWYDATDLVVVNSSPTAVPTTDYAGQFTAANSEFLSIADNAPLSMNGTDFTVAVRVRADTLNGLVIAAKGDVGATGQEWSLYTSGSDSQQFKFRVSTGSLQSVVATNFGVPSTNTWYWVLASWNNTTKAMTISVNNGSENSFTASGSISNTTNAFRLGADTVGRYWDGRIDKFRLWKRLLSSGEKATVYNSGNPLKVEDFDYELRRGLFMAAELDEVSGNRSDAFQHWTYVDNNTVTQASAN